MKSKVVHPLLLLLFCLMPTIALSDVQLALVVNPDPVRPGEQLNVELTVTNPDSSQMTNVELILHYPEHLDSLFPPYYITTGGATNTVVCSSGSYCNTGALVTWRLGDLPPGGGVTVTLPPTVLSGTVDGTPIQFAAEVIVNGTQQAQASKTALVQANPFFELTVDEETDPVTSSGNREYTLSYGNIAATSSNTQLTFPLPTGTSFVSATDGGSEAAGEVTWNIGSLINGEGGERKVTVHVNNTNEADLLKVDTALLSGTDSNSVFHQVKTERVTRVEDDERPALAINLNPHPVKKGEQLDVELIVTNPTSSLMVDVELILRYPEHLDSLYLPYYVTTGGAANTVTCTVGHNAQTAALVTWSLGNLPPGGGVTVTMPPHVNSETVDGTLIQFEAEVRVDGIQQVQASKTARVQANPFFELTVDEETDPVTSSGNREYTLSYGNIAATSSNTQLTFPLPTGTSFVSATDGGSEAAGEVTWNIGSLINGEGGERKVTVHVNNTNEADLLKVDTALLSGTDSNSVFHQVKTERVTRVEDDERPALAINLNPHPVKKGEQLDVELIVTNPTSSLMVDVELILRYPEHLDSLYLPYYVTTGGAANTVTCTVGHNAQTAALVTWSLGNLPPGGGVTVTMPPHVNSETVDGTLIQFEAEVRVDGIQQVQASKTARVQANPFFELTVDEETDPVTSSGNREYTLTYGNIATTTSSNTQLTFPLPTGTSFVSATDGGSEVAGEVTWNIGSLINGGGGERKVTVQVNANEADLLEVDTALLSGTDPNSVSHQMKTGRITRVEDDERPTLAINVNPHPVSKGEQLDVELTVTNPTSSLMTDVALILRYPEHLDSLSSSYITTGDAANTVVCSSGVNCITAALVTWNLNTLAPGEGVTVTMPPTVLSETADGTLIQFEAEVRVDGTQQASISKTAFVGSVFTFVKYTVIADAGVNGSLDGSTLSPQLMDYGSTTQFTFNADTNYHLASISGCGINYSNTDNSVSTYTATTETITANCTVSATFAINQYSVTASVGAYYGSLDGSTPSPQTVDFGSTTQFIFKADTNYHLASVTGCGINYTNSANSVTSQTVTTEAVTANCAVAATFAINTYTVNSSITGGHGSINPQGDQTIDYNVTPSFILLPDNGYHVNQVSGTCGGSLSGTTYTVDAVITDCTVVVSFSINTYTVTSSLSGGHGTINPSGNQTVDHGEIKQFSLIPETEYHVDQITGSCGGTLSGTTFTTNAISSDCTVIAAFSDKYTLSLVFAGNGSGNVTISNTPIEIDDCTANCNADLLHDTEVILSATADNDSAFVGWSGDGCTGTDDCTITMNQAREITAIFKGGFPWAMFLPAFLGADRQ